MYHLRHIGLQPTNAKVKDVFRIDGDATMIGRGQSVDMFLDSEIRRGLISRAHAQIIKTIKNGIDCYTLYDTSLNGTYVNDVKVQGSISIKHGDTIAFGHLRGVLIKPGDYAPQTESEFIFKFEKILDVQKEVKSDGSADGNIPPSIYMSPISLNSKNSSDASDGGGSNHPSENTSRKRRRKSSENELNDLINSVTESVGKENKDSQDDMSFDIAGDAAVDNDMKVPSHPRNLMFPKTKIRSVDVVEDIHNEKNSEKDIKSETSISVDHVDYTERSACESVKQKMKEILDDHDSDKKIDNIESEVVVDEKSCESNYENFSSESSEEVTDDDSDDSDFSLQNYKSPVKKPPSKRNKKAPNKYSPTHSKNKKDISDTREKLSRCSKRKQTAKMADPALSEDSNEENYEHDKCASLECRRPPNSLKKVTWVQCEDCEKWYHLACCGISPKLARNKDTVFRCGC